MLHHVLFPVLSVKDFYYTLYFKIWAKYCCNNVAWMATQSLDLQACSVCMSLPNILPQTNVCCVFILTSIDLLCWEVLSCVLVYENILQQHLQR